jgi:thiamine biosynthesis lipoprotein
MMGNEMTRRDFIKRSALLGLGLVGASVVPGVSEAVRFDSKAYKVTRTVLQIGTVVSITVVDPSRDLADDAISAAFEEVKRLEAILTRFDSASPVAALNGEGFIKEVPPELKRVLGDSIRYHEITMGAFDITVKPVLDLYEKSSRQGKVPGENEIERLMPVIGTRYISFDGDRVRFQKEGMGITLDGIAKGFIVDRAAEVLEGKRVKNYLINAGGDIRVSGERKEGGPWKIAIEDPQKRSQYPDVIQMRSGAIATSGNYEVYFDNEKVFHHIVDPSTGRSPLELASVSVVAKTCEEADALSTALFVMGASRAEGFVRDYPAEYLLVSRDGGLFSSRGWKSLKV